MSIRRSRRPTENWPLRAHSADSGSDQRGETLPDVTLVVRDLAGAEDAERLERALTRLSFVNLVNVDSEKGLVAVSYSGGEAELEEIEGAVREAGHEPEPTPGADSLG